MEPMKCAWIVALAAACVGSERNPAFCGDGVCIDPERPFCDVDASFSGNPGTCVAVSCTPGTFEQCRGDIALTCSADGNNFDLVECPLGCDETADGCRQCTGNTQCDADQICDAMTSSCRGCITDDECSSQVCDVAQSRCVDEATIVYVGPDAVDGTGTCSRVSPCSFNDGRTAAFSSLPPKLVRMLPGSYTRPINSIGLGPTLDVVASGVEIAVGDGTPNILVDKGAKLRIRGLSTVNGQQVQCGSPSAMPSELSLEGVNLRSAGASGAVRVERCTLRLERAEILNVPDISLHDSATLLADRVYVRALFPNSNGFVTFGSNIKANVQNSVFEQLVLNTFIGGATSPNVDLVFANTTFVDSGDQQYCSNARPANLTNFRVLFENSVLHALNPSIDVLRTPTNLCTFANTLLTKQAAPPPGSIVGDAKFVDAPQRDYHLQLGSAAIDVGMAGILTTDHDFDGTARPQGLKPDLGAFEFKP